MEWDHEKHDAGNAIPPWSEYISHCCPRQCDHDGLGRQRQQRAGRCSRGNVSIGMERALITASQLGEHSVCHRGFLDVARRMDETAEQVIRQSKPETYEPVTLLFTGHSAGAAVAQLLFAFAHSKTTKLSKIASSKFPKITSPPLFLSPPSLTIHHQAFKKVDCITFAGPPIAHPPIPCPPGSLFLAFVNEGDPVPLAQTKYVESLLEAYARPPPAEAVNWELPDPFYSFSGTCLLLRDTAPDEADVLDIRAFTVEPAVLNKALFGNLVLHGMAEYRDRVIMLEKRALESVLL